MPTTADGWEVVPNLAIEVVSPTNTASDLDAKVEEYFHAGVELVWVIYPVTEKIYVYESITQISIVTASDVLDGGAVLPGFRLALSELFEHLPENGTAP